MYPAQNVNECKVGALGFLPRQKDTYTQYDPITCGWKSYVPFNLVWGTTLMEDWQFQEDFIEWTCSGEDPTAEEDDDDDEDEDDEDDEYDEEYAEEYAEEYDEEY